MVWFWTFASKNVISCWLSTWRIRVNRTFSSIYANATTFAEIALSVYSDYFHSKRPEWSISWRPWAIYLLIDYHRNYTKHCSDVNHRGRKKLAANIYQPCRNNISRDHFSGWPSLFAVGRMRRRKNSPYLCEETFHSALDWFLSVVVKVYNW